MNLRELIESDRPVIFLDGAMGTELGAIGLEMGGQNNVSHPDAVAGIHLLYADCGADLLITNTLTMNRVNIESHNIGVDVREVNLAGARLARLAAGSSRFVLGDIGSTGKMLKPYGQLSADEAAAAFSEQAAILAEGGVDGFIIETMFDLREALLAVRAAKEAGGLPVLACIAFNTANNGGRTVMGDTGQDCAQALTEAGVCAVGANCGNLDPLEMAAVVAAMREATTLPLIAQPNAGKPRMVDKQAAYDLSPADFAAGVKECARAGARLLGGCCGTSPAHLRAMVSMLAPA